MKFVDKVKILVKSGKGGAGASSFRREKYAPKGGPDGGNGGSGGSVILQVFSRIQTLMDLHLKKKYLAQNGENGKNKKKYGKDGLDTIIKVPCGTLVLDENNELLYDLVEDQQTYIVAKGGKGGLGNANFSTPTNQTPRYAQTGLPGKEKTISLELRLIAEIGLIGLPNAGKSTLLKAITRANPKIADYPFTTLFPNLGVLKYIDREIVLADIPGLIEGASSGHGLGADFLRHVDRTKILLHLVDGSLKEPEQCWNEFETINKELKQSSYNLEQKPTIVVITKIDMIDEAKLKEIQQHFKANKIETLAISSFSQKGLENLKNRIILI
jgi:GTPase